MKNSRLHAVASAIALLWMSVAPTVCPAQEGPSQPPPSAPLAPAAVQASERESAGVADEQAEPQTPSAAEAPAQQEQTAAVCDCPTCRAARRRSDRSIFGWIRRRLGCPARVKNKICSTSAEERYYIPPAGHALSAFLQTQITNGESARMALYHYDFVPGDSRLTRRGKRQLAKIAPLLLRNPSPLIIEKSRQNRFLDERRRLIVEAELAKLSVDVPHSRIVVGRRPTRALDGIEAEFIYGSLLQLKATSGSSTTGGGGGSASGSSSGGGS